MSSPILRIIISKIAKVQHLLICLILLLLYSIFSLFIGRRYGFSDYIGFSMIFFITSYIKFYFEGKIKKRKLLVIIIASVLSIVLFVILVDYFGLKYSFLSNKVQFWSYYTNLPILALSLCLLLLFAKIEFTNNFLKTFFKTVSSCSLLIYLISENYLVMNYLKPALFSYIYYNYTYRLISLNCLLLSIAVFVSSVLISIAFEYSFGKLIKIINERIIIPAEDRFYSFLKNYK